MIDLDVVNGNQNATLNVDPGASIPMEVVPAGQGGTDNYNTLLNKPSINNVTLIGNKSLTDIGIGEEAYFINKQDFTNPTTVNSNASSVINAALTAAKAAGKNYCVVPEGEYWLTETVYLQDNVILKGCGMDATTLKIADGCDIDAIRVASPIHDAGIMDLTIDGNRITNYSTFHNGHHGNAINVWLHYGRIERVRTNWVYKHSLLLNYDTGNSDDGLGFDSEHQNDMGNLNKVLWCDFRDSLLQAIMWGWRTMDSWMCYTNIGSHAANLYLEGGTSRFIGNHFDGDGDNGAGPEYNVYCGDGCQAMLFDGNIFENTQKQNIFFRQPSYSNHTMTITISNNIIRTCSKSQNEQYPNIYISGYSDSVKATEIAITGNQILNPDTNANHGYAGVHLAYCSNCKIIGNTFFNVGANEVIVDNTCDNILNDGSLPRDVQVNGTSILNNGVANVPIASDNVFGVMKIMASNGIALDTNRRAYIVNATSQIIKIGTNEIRPITPNRQHESTFYGFAKAAGDSTQSASSNAVGTYTEAAKSKITDMIEPKFRLIKEITITEETGDITINTDSNGGSFLLKECIIVFDGMKANNNGTGGIYVNRSQYGANDDKPYLASSGMYNATSVFKVINLYVRGGRFFGDGTVTTYSNAYTTNYNSTSMYATGIIATNPISEITIVSLNGYKFTEGTIKVYGR